MCRLSKFQILLLVFSALLYSVEVAAQLPAVATDGINSSEQRLFRPKLQMGFGMLHYSGDVGNLGGVSQSTQLNWGHHLLLQNPLGQGFDLNVFALFGKISAAERLPQSMPNFQTDIKMGGASISYNFHHLLPSKRLLTPFVSLGITSFEFNPKGNTKDQFGRAYHHWSDGTVRSFAENSPNASVAIPLIVDNTFETDLRMAEGSQNLYALRAISIPVGAGADIELSKKFNLRLAAELHFTNSDYLDGIAYETQGLNRNDRLLYTSIGLSYNLHHDRKPLNHEKPKEINTTLPEEDEDGDSVSDFADLCPCTPAGVSVDEHGCPLDSDKDGVPDYLDKEPNSAPGAYVDADGITMTDAQFERQYKIYLGELFDQNFEKSTTSTTDLARNTLQLGSRKRGYRVVLDADAGLSNEELAKVLSIPDIQAREVDGRTSYYAGDYTSTSQLLTALSTFKLSGLAYSLQYNDFGKLTEIDEDALFGGTEYAELLDLLGGNEIVFRVQIGAFSKAVSPKLFKDIPNVLVIPGDDGLTRYVSGSYKSIQEAAKHRVNLLLKGYEGAFVTAYRGGKRITLKEAGATVTESPGQKNEPKAQINKDFVKYAVQLGVFKGRIPAETLSNYMSLGNVRPLRTDDGTTKYIHGSFETPEQARIAMEDLRKRGFKDIFVVGDFNGQVITTEEAKKLRSE